MAGFFYICDYLDISPQEFFRIEDESPNLTREILSEIERLFSLYSRHILQVIQDLNQKK